MTPEQKRLVRRRMTLESAADVLEALHSEGMIEAAHGIAVGIHTYLRKVSQKVAEKIDGEEKTA